VARQESAIYFRPQPQELEGDRLATWFPDGKRIAQDLRREQRSNDARRVRAGQVGIRADADSHLLTQAARYLEGPVHAVSDVRGLGERGVRTARPPQCGSEHIADALDAAERLAELGDRRLDVGKLRNRDFH
jgi:hypothetical protein